MIAAIIILFHPDQQATGRLLSSLAGQVDTVFAIDNTPGATAGKPPFLEGFRKPVSYIPLGENRGIAEAQNIGINLSIRDGHSHVLLLDQDSALSPGMVGKLLAAEEKILKNGKRVTAMCPQIIDQRTGNRPCAFRYRWLRVQKLFRDVSATEPVQTDVFIASGSLIQISTLQSLGVMRSDLFIDHVDTEWALRGKTAGYNSYCVPDAVLLHSFGDAAIKLFGNSVYLHADIRRYYQLRNEVYLTRLKTMGWQWRIYALSRIPYHLLVYSAFSQNRFRTFCLLWHAIWDGLKGKLGPVTLPPPNIHPYTSLPADS